MKFKWNLSKHITIIHKANYKREQNLFNGCISSCSTECDLSTKYLDVVALLEITIDIEQCNFTADNIIDWHFFHSPLEDIIFLCLNSKVTTSSACIFNRLQLQRLVQAPMRITTIWFCKMIKNTQFTCKARLGSRQYKIKIE